MWIIAALLSSFFAGITAILAKSGIRKTDSDIATALRTIVVLFFSWIMAFTAGSVDTIAAIETRSFLFLILSGLATGASWLCYFKALVTGDVNKVVPIDKSSTVLVVLFSIFFFHETRHLAVQLTGAAILTAGIFLMIEKKASTQKVKDSRWIIYAILSALFAALTSILAKIGIEGVESNLATAIRTCVVLIMAWLIVFAKKGWLRTAALQESQSEFIRYSDSCSAHNGISYKLKKDKLSSNWKSLSRNRKELICILLSGITTGASWLCYYYAIQNGIVSIVVPIDKLSIVVSIIFSYFVFKEKLTTKAFTGLLLMVCGTLVMVWSGYM